MGEHMFVWYQSFSNLCYSTSNLTEMINAVQVLASITQHDASGKNLENTAHELVTACIELIGAIESENVEVNK